MSLITVKIDSYLHLSRAELREAGFTVRRIKEPFEYPNPEFWKKKRMGLFVGGVPETFSLVRIEPGEVLIPRGGLSRLKRVLQECELRYVDETVSGTGPLPSIYAEPEDWTLGVDQLSAARQALRWKQGLILGVCASGKTEVLLKFISSANERTLILVHTERILKDWERKISERFFLKQTDVGVLYGKAKREGRPITVGMIQTVRNRLRKNPSLARTWGTVVLDEAHHAPADSTSEIVNALPARYRIGATATPKRKDGKEVLLFDTFGSELVPKSRGRGLKVGPRILYEITDEDLDLSGRILPVDVVIVPTSFEFDLHLERAMELHGWERKEGETAMTAGKRFARRSGYQGPENTYADMLEEMTRNEDRLLRILEYLLPAVRVGETCLLLADRRELCLQLQSWLKHQKIDCGRLMGAKDAKTQDRTIEGLTTGALSVAVGTTVADEGMDVARLSVGLGCTPVGSNPGRFIQQVGRFKRKYPGKERATYFYFWDRRVRGLRGHAREVFRAVKTPHRVWYSEKPGERVPMTTELLKRLEGGR